jgi:tRNA(Arg) A34 adenosine deaminase TadA
MKEDDVRLIRVAIGVAQKAKDKGNHPFGAILVDRHGRILLEAENTVVTAKDCTGHAETNLMRLASQKYDPEFLAHCTLYASTEPCPMCTGAIFWGNVRRIVFGLSEKSLYAMIDDDSEEVLRLSSRDLLANGRKSIEVVGPLLEEEASLMHVGFWG